MKIIYEAFDGTQFDDEFKCEDYEWRKEHNEMLKDLTFYDKDGKILEDKLSEETYNKVMIIDVYNINALQAIQDIANYTGFLCYDAINSTGFWTWNEENSEFEKNSD